MDRFLRASGGTVTTTLYDATTGLPTDPAPATATATVTDSAGVAIAGSPFTATHGTAGVFSITIPNTLTVLDTYAVTWNIGDGSKKYSEFEVVGGFYFTPFELRATDATLANLSMDNCRFVRSVVEDRFEQQCRVAFVPRGKRYLTSGDGSTLLTVPSTSIPVRSVVSATINGVALTSPELADLKVYPGGLIQRDQLGVWTSGRPQNVTVLYEYGETEPPAPVKQAALRYARHIAVPHAWDDDRMISFQTDVGIVQQSVARNGKLGFPDVDSVLDAYANIGALVL